MLGVEVLNLIKDFLDCRISVHKVYLIFEDNLDFLVSKQSLECFSLAMELQELEFKADEIDNYTKNGMFKNFMNFRSFLQKSGTLSKSKSAYWNLHVKQFNVSFSLTKQHLKRREIPRVGNA